MTINVIQIFQEVVNFIKIDLKEVQPLIQEIETIDAKFEENKAAIIAILTAANEPQLISVVESIDSSIQIVQKLISLFPKV